MIISVDDIEDPRFDDYRALKEADLVGRRGVFVAEGSKVVELWASRPSRFRFRSILLGTNRLDAMRAVLPSDTPIYVAPPEVMDRVVGFHVVGPNAGEMIAEGCGRGGEAEVTILLSTKPGRDLLDTRKKRLDEVVKLFPRRSEGKGPSLEKLHPEVAFELGNLTAHRRLLNTVWHLADGFGDAFMFGHIIEEFEVVDVHGRSAVRRES